jgi:hypothetical protein
MTMDELNALYNNMSVYGDTYTSPTTTIPTDPNAGQPPILEPLIPALPMQYINQGGDNDKGGITSIAPATYEQTYDPNLNFAEFTSGVKGTPSFTQEYTKRPGVGIQSLFELLQKISPMANIMKLGKTGIETAQKYFADKKETERLEVLAQIEQAKKQKEAQAIIAAAEEQATREAATATRAMAANPDVYSNAGITSGGFASQNTGSNPSFSNKTGRGRTGYGTGGIVSL